MCAARKNKDRFPFNRIYDSVRIVNPAAPKTFQISLQWFWFTYSFKRMPSNIFYKTIDTLERFLVLRLPIHVVVPSVNIPF